MGRVEEVAQLLVALERQTLQASCIILSVVDQSDIPAKLLPGVLAVFGCAGLPAQRNRGLSLALTQCDIVVFYDDDFLPANDSLQAIAVFFQTHPEMSGATGRVLKDSVNLPGLSYREALEVIAAYEAEPRPKLVNGENLFAYGCNMAFRCAAIGERRFDENLPRYAWQEDMDFAAQISREGKVVRTNAFAGVHRGVTTSRGNPGDLGFSQIVNPVYLMRKGTMTPKRALRLILRSLAGNHLKLFRPSVYGNRFGRLRGNWQGLFHLISGKADPMAIPSLRPNRKS